jgi:ABC-type lipoprotein release transport system permease subunit
MVRFRLLPWEYGVRNLFRRPLRSALTLTGLALVALLVFIVVGFIRGLETSLSLSGDPNVVIVYSRGESETLENSSIGGSTPLLLAASVPGIARRTSPDGGQVVYASPEVYLGTRVKVGDEPVPTLGLVRGVTPPALLVRSKAQILAGHWPGPGEVMVGQLAAAKIGRDAADLIEGKTIWFEGRTWTISGTFAAAGSALESEIWCPLDDLQQTMKRQDLSLVAVKLGPGATFGDIDEFCKDQLKLELQATPELAYYDSLRKHYRPVRMLAWLVVGLVAGAGVFVGLNTMYGAVAGRVREMATLQVLGFPRRAVALSLVQEGTLLAMAGSLLSAAIAVTMLNGAAVRFTMGAFPMRIDGFTVLVGCGVGLLLGVVGSVPPALRAMRHEVAEGLKAVG